MFTDSLEKKFDRALRLSFSKKKFLFLSPILFLCGILTVASNAILQNVGHLGALSLVFLPLFFSSGFLLSSGVVLIKAYEKELKKHPFSLKEILKDSWQMLMNICYISLPIVFFYLVLWLCMGMFYLLKELPVLGDFFGAFFAFGPFLLMLAVILLFIANIVSLFFGAPEAALGCGIGLELLFRVKKRLTSHNLTNLLNLFLGLLPVGFCVSLLYLAATLTGGSFFGLNHPVSKLFQSLIMMIPFCSLLTPSVIFFYNFSAESFLFYKVKEKSESELKKAT